MKQWIRKTIPDRLFPFIGTVYCFCHPFRDLAVILPHGDTSRAINISERETLHYPNHKLGVRVAGAYKGKYEKYVHEGFVEPQPGDVVVEVGTFVGEFTKEAATVADTVIAVEPDPSSVLCLEKNTCEFDNVEIIESVISNKLDRVTFSLGNDPTENSLVSIDKEGTRGELTVDARTIEDICTERNLKVVDYLKVDGEGAEPEILKGIGDIEVRKVAIDVGPEREGERTDLMVRDILSKRGYEITSQDDVLFAKFSD